MPTLNVSAKTRDSVNAQTESFEYDTVDEFLTDVMDFLEDDKIADAFEEEYEATDAGEDGE